MEALQQPTFETKTFERGYNESLRKHNDTVTWLAEVLDGSMRTSFDYCFDGQELRADDGTAMSSIFYDSLLDSHELARRNPMLSFEQRRRQHELGEYKEMLAMARGVLPNTMVVVSDFPPELLNATKDVGGYNVHRKQTMVRVITRNPDGTITMRSQSLDRSDRQALENMYYELGFASAQGELLGQRMHLQVDDPLHQELLIDKLMYVYDKTLSDRYGQAFYGGRTDTDRRNTTDFVLSQTDLIDTYVNHINYDTENLQRSIAAAMTERFEGKSTAFLGGDYSTNEVESGMADAGKRADKEGRTFSGCGVTSSAKSQLELLGLGNKTCIEVKNGQKVKCPGCKEMVKAIVSANKESIHCSNKSCKLAHPSIKHSGRRKKTKKQPDSRVDRKKKQQERKEKNREKRKRPAKAW